jgi:hypothetical protein
MKLIISVTSMSIHESSRKSVRQNTECTTQMHTLFSSFPLKGAAIHSATVLYLVLFAPLKYMNGESGLPTNTSSQTEHAFIINKRLDFIVNLDHVMDILKYSI